MTTKKRNSVPKSTLTEDDFWALIAQIDHGKKPRKQLAAVIAALAERGVPDVKEFDEILAHRLFAIDGQRFVDHAGSAGGSDGFLYARCFVVGRGKDFYEEVLARPESFPPDVGMEELLRVAHDAFLLITGDDAYDHATQYSYESGTNTAAWPDMPTSQ